MLQIKRKEEYEKYSVLLEDGDLTVALDVPVLLQILNGPSMRLRYETWEEIEGAYTGIALAEDLQGNQYRITDTWRADGSLWRLDRKAECTRFCGKAAIHLTSDFRCRARAAGSLDDYQFLIPGALYNKNDTDGDGMDDYLGTFCQDYKDDRNPSMSVTAYAQKGRRFVSLIRADVPVRDHTITREQIRARYFVHDTDIGSLGVSPSPYHAGEVILRSDYPFYERNSFCLNVDGSEWEAFAEVKEGELFTVSYLIQAGEAADLTGASWATTCLQMERILDPEVKLPFTLEEARQARRRMIHGSFREFPEKKGHPAGYFVHFSPREKYGSQNLLEYGFCGAQTLLSLDMLEAARETKDEAYRERALKTVEFFVENCIEESGLPNGIYNVDKEEYVYWWTGILFPFQYSRDREELEGYLGNQVVSSLMRIAQELEKHEGNYCRSMVDSMYYLLRCWQMEKDSGVEHENWYRAVEKFCDRLLEMQNENGSWNRGYTMEGAPLTEPAEWFGATEEEQGSGAIFPAPLLVDMYRSTGEKKYLDAAVRAADFIYRSYVRDVKYIGGINDTTHKKSVKEDAASVMFAMRSLLRVYEETKKEYLLEGARDAARILGSWTYLWNIPFDRETLLGEYGFGTTGWTICDVIPAGSYVDCEFPEFVPDLLRIAEYCHDRELGILARIVTRGMQHGLSMPGHMYGYALEGVQCEGYMSSLWLADTQYKKFSGAAAKNKGDDNDTCNGLVNGQALLNFDSLVRRYGTLDFDVILQKIGS